VVKGDGTSERAEILVAQLQLYRSRVERKRTVKAVLTRSSYLEVGQALIAETIANVGQEELAC
jgi:hypothetical protein